PYIKMSGHMMVIFFFQAEDGIRDRNVTGVQTCALPISDKPEKTEISAARTAPADDNRPETTTSQKNVPPYAQLRVPARQAQVGRSEERRVGKEGRARGEPEHEKKKREERKTGAGEQQTR